MATGAHQESSETTTDRRARTVLMVGNYLPSLAAIRSLGAAGYRVIAGDGGEFSTVDRSRYCHEVWMHPLVSRREDFLRALLALLERRPEIGVILPLQEHYVALLAEARQRLPSDRVIASPPASVVLTCLDKQGMFAIARDVGVPVQSSAVVSDLTGLAAACAEVGFPCIVRPPKGASHPMPGDRKAIICGGHEELGRTFVSWPGEHPTLLVQHYSPGPRHNVAFAARGGRIIARVETKALRVGTADGTGLRVEGISVAPDPRLVGYCDALVERLGYTGVGLAQFILPPGAEPHFLELNPRHGVALAFVQQLGLDLTQAAIELARPDGDWQVAAGFSYPVGKRYAWTTGDLHALRTARARGDVGWMDSLRWLARTIRAAARARAHATWSVGDPLPTLAILAQWLPHGPWKRAPLRDRRHQGSGAARTGRPPDAPMDRQ